MGMKEINRSRYRAERKKQSRKKKEMKELTHGRKVKRKKKKKHCWVLAGILTAEERKEKKQLIIS